MYQYHCKLYATITMLDSSYSRLIKFTLPNIKTIKKAVATLMLGQGHGTFMQFLVVMAGSTLLSVKELKPI